MSNLSNPFQFEVVYKQYFSSLVGFAFQYVESSEIAEDVVQDVFGKVWNQSGELDIRTNIKSYLFGAVRNACLNHLRHEKVKQVHVDESSGDEMDQIDFLEMDELQELIQHTLDQLPEKRRQVFELSRFEGKKYQEIAEELDISVKTVETQMSRALRALREAVGSYLIWLICLTMIYFLTSCQGKI